MSGSGTLRDRLAAVLGPGNDDATAYAQADAVLEVLALEQGRPRLARYFTRVHAENRHAGYGVPIVVLAATRREAVSRAIDLGWNGERRWAQVTIDRVDDLP